VAATWNSSSADERLALVCSARRKLTEVLRPKKPMGHERWQVVVFAGLKQQAVDVLHEARPFLSDEEMALLARALGYGD
jgi:hypothetical protein